MAQPHFIVLQAAHVTGIGIEIDRRGAKGYVFLVVWSAGVSRGRVVVEEAMPGYTGLWHRLRRTARGRANQCEAVHLTDGPYAALRARIDEDVRGGTVTVWARGEP